MFRVLMKCLDVLESCGDEEDKMSVNRKLVHCLSPDHLLENRTILAYDNISREKIANVVRRTYADVIKGSTKLQGRH